MLCLSPSVPSYPHWRATSCSTTYTPHVTFLLKEQPAKKQGFMMTLTSGHLGQTYTLKGRGGRRERQLHEAPTCRIVAEMCQREWLAEEGCVTGTCTCRRGRACLACRRVGKCSERWWMGACLARQRVCKCAGREWEGVCLARQRAGESGARAAFLFVGTSSCGQVRRAGGGVWVACLRAGVRGVRGH